MDKFDSDTLKCGDDDKRCGLTRGHDGPGSIFRESIDGKTCRYILGAPSDEGENIIVIGLNPNTADDAKPDETMKIVKKEVLEVLGARGYVMLNLCPYRAGKPDLLPKQADEAVMQENVQAFEDVLAMPPMRDARVWAAWGSAITKRAYLAESLRQIVAAFKAAGHEGAWFQMGGDRDDGHRHPYHPNQWARKELMPWKLNPTSFDVDGYLDKFGRK